MIPGNLFVGNWITTDKPIRTSHLIFLAARSAFGCTGWTSHCTLVRTGNYRELPRDWRAGIDNEHAIHSGRRRRSKRAQLLIGLLDVVWIHRGVCGVWRPG